MILFQIEIYKKYMILHGYFEYIVQWATNSYEKRRPRVWDMWSLSDLMHCHIVTAHHGCLNKYAIHLLRYLQ